MFQVDQKRGEELKGVKVKRKQPSYWGAIEELLRSCKNCCGIISEWVSETNYKIGEATLGSPFVHVFLRSENPSLGIRDTLKRWSSLLNTRLCIPRVSGSSPPSSTNTIMFIIVIFTCFRCWQESDKQHLAVNRWQQVGEQIFSEELDKGYQKAFLRQAQAFIESEEFEKAVKICVNFCLY